MKGILVISQIKSIIWEEKESIPFEKYLKYDCFVVFIYSPMKLRGNFNFLVYIKIICIYKN